MWLDVLKNSQRNPSYYLVLGSHSPYSVVQPKPSHTAVLSVTVSVMIVGEGSDVGLIVTVVVLEIGSVTELSLIPRQPLNTARPAISSITPISSHLGSVMILPESSVTEEHLFVCCQSCYSVLLFVQIVSHCVSALSRGVPACVLVLSRLPDGVPRLPPVVPRLNDVDPQPG